MCGSRSPSSAEDDRCDMASVHRVRAIVSLGSTPLANKNSTMSSSRSTFVLALSLYCAGAASSARKSRAVVALEIGSAKLRMIWLESFLDQPLNSGFKTAPIPPNGTARLAKANCSGRGAAACGGLPRQRDETCSLATRCELVTAGTRRAESVPAAAARWVLRASDSESPKLGASG